MKCCQNCGLQTEKTYAFSAKEFRINIAKKLTGSLAVCEKCASFHKERKEKLKLVTDSKAHLRLIVSGPGTGKTFTFMQVIKKMPPNSNARIFTLINNLANDLINEFDKPEFANVKASTFHGYCKELLYSKLGFDGIYYPNLATIIESDAAILELSYSKKNFHAAFANLDEENASLLFFLSRSSYYSAISHQDSVYKVYKALSSNSYLIPQYDLVIADEYQDFNKLESSFINVLSSKNPILVAGDDDQSLYGFRKASKKFIINLYNSLPSNQKFNLPFSSRCTSVLVNSVNSLIKKAISTGLLHDRINDKKYISYWPDKFALDTKYPQIIEVQCSVEKTAFKFIKNHIETITNNESLVGTEKDIQFLVIGAESQHRLDSLAKYLVSNLDMDLFMIEKKENESNNEIVVGYKMVRADEKNNLGWRIILREDPLESIATIIKRSHRESVPIFELLPEVYKNKHMVKIEEYFSEKNTSNEIITENPNKVRVKLTNYLGSKGLSALHVIIWECHNGVLPASPYNITGEDIYRFVVALTRAKRSCAIVSFKVFDRLRNKLIGKRSALLNYLPQSNLRVVKCRISKGNLKYED